MALAYRVVNAVRRASSATVETPECLLDTVVTTGMGVFVVGQRNRLLLFRPVGRVGLYRAKAAQRAPMPPPSAVANGLCDHGSPSLPTRE